MRKLMFSLAALSLPAGAWAEPVAFATQNERSSALAQSCRSLAGTSASSGFYWVQLQASPAVYAVMYCENTVEYSGIRGGWTLVWSNLRGGRGKLTSDLHWGASIESLPRYRGSSVLTSTPDLQSFEVYTGLRWWRRIMDDGGRREILYEWAHNYGDQRQLDRRAACRFDLNSSPGWTITFNSSSCQALIGTSLPALVETTNGRRWSTVDSDNDTHPSGCSGMYSGTPWWYSDCWGGSINGGGEDSASGHYNGAYWNGSAKYWGQADGTGAGNGWIYIR